MLDVAFGIWVVDFELWILDEFFEFGAFHSRTLFLDNGFLEFRFGFVFWFLGYCNLRCPVLASL